MRSKSPWILVVVVLAGMLGLAPARGADVKPKGLAEVLQDQKDPTVALKESLDQVTIDPGEKSPDSAAKTFEEKAGAVRTAAAKLLDSWDAPVLGAIGPEKPEAFDFVNAELGEQKTIISKALAAAIATEVEAIEKSAADTLKDRLSKSVDVLKVTIQASFDARRGALERAAKDTSQKAAAAAYQKGLDKARDEAFKEYFAKYGEHPDVTPVMHCALEIRRGDEHAADPADKAPKATIRCNGDALQVSGATVAVVTIDGDRQLYDARMVTVNARITEALRKIPKENAPEGDSIVLSAQELKFPSDRLRTGVPLEIDVHTDRWLGPTYASSGSIIGRHATKMRVLKTLREDFPDRLSLITQGRGHKLLITVDILQEYEQHLVATYEMPLAYERWKFETSSFYAVSHLADKELIEEADADGAKQVIGTRAKDNERHETGILLSMVPRNYEYFGMGVGFSISEGRSPSYYIGPTVRLLGLGDRGLASFSAGLAGVQVREFPDVKTCPTLTACTSSSDVARLGRLSYHHGWYVSLALGFRFGPIGKESSKE